MPTKRIRYAIKMALVLPVYQILNLIAYANTRQGRTAKFGTFVCFLPIIALTTIWWAAAWTIALWSIRRALEAFLTLMAQ
jgi:hypothetical protein